MTWWGPAQHPRPLHSCHTKQPPTVTARTPLRKQRCTRRYPNTPDTCIFQQCCLCVQLWVNLLHVADGKCLVYWSLQNLNRNRSLPIVSGICPGIDPYRTCRESVLELASTPRVWIRIGIDSYRTCRKYIQELANYTSRINLACQHGSTQVQCIPDTVLCISVVSL